MKTRQVLKSFSCWLHKLPYTEKGLLWLKVETTFLRKLYRILLHMVLLFLSTLSHLVQLARTSSWLFVFWFTAISFFYNFLQVSSLQYRKMDFEEFAASSISVYQMEALDTWEQHARRAYEFFEKEGNRPIMIEELASVYLVSVLL